ncbi:MAG: OmpH family outer membrane protein [Gemmatimonadetes bacterium]|nr:OmpH family outer membrane protein [Gemmatimonadota bacterium]
MARLITSLIGLTTVVFIATPTALAAQVGVKIAFVDSRLILQQTPGYIAADSQFTRELGSWRAEVQRLQASLDSAARAFEQSSVILSPSARDAKRQDLIQQQATLETRAADLETRAATRQRELLDPIEQRVNQAIEQVRASGSYAIIFDVGSPGSGIVAADRSLDLTQVVIDALTKPAN